MCAKLVEIGMRQCHHVNVCSCYIPIPIVHVCVSIIGVDCGSLVSPIDGIVSTSLGTLFMSIATYYCNTGYEISGASHRTCGATGQWRPNEPSCNRKYLYGIFRLGRDFKKI